MGITIRPYTYMYMYVYNSLVFSSNNRSSFEQPKRTDNASARAQWPDFPRKRGIARCLRAPIIPSSDQPARTQDVKLPRNRREITRCADVSAPRSGASVLQCWLARDATFSENRAPRVHRLQGRRGGGACQGLAYGSEGVPSPVRRCFCVRRLASPSNPADDAVMLRCPRYDALLHAARVYGGPRCIPLALSREAREGPEAGRGGFHSLPSPAGYGK